MTAACLAGELTAEQAADVGLDPLDVATPRLRAVESRLGDGRLVVGGVDAIEFGRLAAERERGRS